MRFSGWELVIILVIILLLFGARKLPDLARSLGASAKEFRKGVDEGSTEEPLSPSPRRQIVSETKIVPETVSPRRSSPRRRSTESRDAGRLSRTPVARCRRNFSLPGHVR